MFQTQEEVSYNVLFLFSNVNCVVVKHLVRNKDLEWDRNSFCRSLGCNEMVKFGRLKTFDP